LIDVADPSQPGIGVETVLPDVSGTVLDLARARGAEIVVLLSDGDSGRLVRVDAGDPQAPTLLANAVLPAGSPPISVAVYCEGRETGCGSSSFVAVVRDGWGVETYTLADLSPLYALPLAGTPRDVRIARDSSGELHVLVTLGFGHGVAAITGLPGPPAVTWLHTPGDTKTFVEHDAGTSGLGDIAVATPTGIVQLTLPTLANCYGGS
jgi:hypothetical protein